MLSDLNKNNKYIPLKMVSYKEKSAESPNSFKDLQKSQRTADKDLWIIIIIIF